MVCHRHLERVGVVQCNECGKALCHECATKFSPPLCIDCANDYANNIKWTMVKNIILSVVLMVIGTLVIESPSGILLAGIPYGWSILNKMTPSMFLWLSWVGWIVYFIIKLIVAYAIGIIALPIKLFKWISELSKVNKILRQVEN